MSLTNFKTAMFATLIAELEAWQNGEKQWNVANQFDETVLESAIENFDNLPEEKWQWFANADYVTVMSIAHEISTFEVEPLADAWTQ